MIIKRSPRLHQRAQELRNNATKAENHLWYDFLSTYPIRFRRQLVIHCFIVDFYCAKARLAIELDGAQHFTEEGLAYDKERSQKLGALSISVLRFSNYDVNEHFEAVCAEIDAAVKARCGSLRQ